MKNAFFWGFALGLLIDFVVIAILFFTGCCPVGKHIPATSKHFAGTCELCVPNDPDAGPEDAGR